MQQWGFIVVFLLLLQFQRRGCCQTQDVTSGGGRADKSERTDLVVRRISANQSGLLIMSHLFSLSVCLSQHSAVREPPWLVQDLGERGGRVVCAWARGPPSEFGGDKLSFPQGPAWAHVTLGGVELFL